MPTALCATCGHEFQRSANRTRFCNHACYVQNARQDADRTLVDRFWAKVNKFAPRGCWLWTASTIRGYGQFHLPRLAGRQHTVYAHRLAWTLTNGEIQDNLFVCHTCDQPLCCNPSHMFLGTQADNLADARQKGRLVDGAHLRKLSDEDMATIRRTYEPRVNGQQLAERYGVCLVTILRVVNGTARVARPAERKSA